MELYVDTCVLPRCRLEEAAVYTERFGPGLGLELLPMFDLPGWEKNLEKNLSLFTGRPLIFHEPVWGVEHSLPKDSPGRAESMRHLLLTKKYADLLQPSAMVYHLSNGLVPPADRKSLLKNSLEALEEMRCLFPGVRLLVENTGIAAEGTQLLNMEEFTETARGQDWDILIDVGHAHANGWDPYRLIDDLKDRIRGFHLHNNDGVHDLHSRIGDGTLDLSRLLPFICRTVPDAFLVIEYCSPELHGRPLLEDLETVAQTIKANAGRAAEGSLPCR